MCGRRIVALERFLHPTDLWRVRIMYGLAMCKLLSTKPWKAPSRARLVEAVVPVTRSNAYRPLPQHIPLSTTPRKPGIFDTRLQLIQCPHRFEHRRLLIVYGVIRTGVAASTNRLPFPTLATFRRAANEFPALAKSARSHGLRSPRQQSQKQSGNLQYSLQ